MHSGVLFALLTGNPVRLTIEQPDYTEKIFSPDTLLFPLSSIHESRITNHESRITIHE